MARLSSTNLFVTVPHVAGTFSPLRVKLRLDNHGYSPTVLKMIVEAAARLDSFADASYALQLANIHISPRHVQRICLEIGQEMIQQRDRKVILRRRRQLPVRGEITHSVVAVEVDGGHLNTRASGSGPGVHDKQDKEEKIACLVTLQSQVSEVDPQPQPPSSFLLPRRVQRLVKKIMGKSGHKPQDDAEKEDRGNKSEPKEEIHNYNNRPHKVVRTCVASMTNSDGFGPMVAVEAQERGFYEAARRAFVGDGAKYNWEIYGGYFPSFVAIVDFLHVLCYIYLAAWGVGADEKDKWSIYVRWLEACWQGRVKQVIEELTSWQERLGPVVKGEKLNAMDPRLLVQQTITYLKNNEERMDYPNYRKQGLPCTSSLAESLVGEFNARVKDPGKHWGRKEGSEEILQLRAAYLSEDDRLTKYFEQRPGSPFAKRLAAELINE